MGEGGREEGSEREREKGRGRGSKEEGRRKVVKSIFLYQLRGMWCGIRVGGDAQTSPIERICSVG